MAPGTRIGTRSALIYEIDLTQWAEVDVDALPDSKRAQFLSRRKAITMYLAGATQGEIKAATGLDRPNIYRLIVKRCLAQGPDGTLLGWRGALPYFRVDDYTRKTAPEPQPASGRGTAGALRWLFESPNGADLEASFRDQILRRAPNLASERRPKKELFNWLIKRLRAEGVERRGEWPFNVEKMGYVTISKFIDKVLDENPVRQRQILGGKEAERKARAGDGVDRPELQHFQRVECDGHKLDARMIVLVPSPHGGYEPRKIHRLWVIVIIEVTSRAVLGYRLSLRKECSAQDVLLTIKAALTRWEPREVHWSENTYVEEAGLPSHRHARYVGACWDEFSVDGALANVCGKVESQLKEVVGSRVLKPQDPHSFSSRRSKDDRPFIEAFFKRLAAGGFHRLSATTGSKPQDKHGNDPDKAAAAAQFQLEYAEELLDSLIANYNATPHSGLGYRSPLAQLDFLTNQSGERLRQADPGDVRRLGCTRKLCTLLGGVRTGRRPYFNFANASYSAEWLVLRTDLVGKLLWVQLEDEEDARYANVSTQDGEFLGIVRAAPPWHRTPHSLFIRQSIRALETRRDIHLSSQCDAVEELIRFSESTADKKLPAHPAYLEARRIIERYAQTLMEQTVTRRDIAQAQAVEAPVDEPAQASSVRPPPPSDKPPGKPAGQLPRMQRAKTW